VSIPFTNLVLLWVERGQKIAPELNLGGKVKHKEVATDKSRIVTYCTDEMKRKLERLAALRFRSVSNLVEAALAEEIARAESSGELKIDPLADSE